MKVISLKKASQSQTISQAVKILRAGGLIIYPTETVYGAGVDVASPQAVAKLSKFKSRSLGKPYSVAAADKKMAQKYAILNPAAKKLYQTFLPGPLTVVSKIRGGAPLAPGVASELDTLGVRIPDYPLIIEIVKKLGRPVTATSANSAWQKRPYSISDILDNISQTKKKLIDIIIDAGRLPRRDPSTVIDTTLDDPVTLRVGEIKLSAESRILSRSPQDTQNLAKELWQKYSVYAGRRAIVFALEGQLGAGKTEFTRGLARAVGIKSPVTSPTYNLANEYRFSSSIVHRPSSTLHHFDAWRLETSVELENLEFSQKITDKSVIALEWADRVADAIRARAQDAVIIWLKIKYAKNPNDRFINWGIL